MFERSEVEPERFQLTDRDFRQLPDRLATERSRQNPGTIEPRFRLPGIRVEIRPGRDEQRTALLDVLTQQRHGVSGRFDSGHNDQSSIAEQFFIQPIDRHMSDADQLTVRFIVG